MNFVDQITRCAMNMPDKPAIVDRDRTISYCDMYSMIAETEGRLQDLGLTEGNRIGLAIRDDTSHLILCLAAARQGIATSSLDWRSSVTEINRIADAVKIRTLVTDEFHLSQSIVPVVDFERQWIDTTTEAPNWQMAPAQNGDLLFDIRLSSGTTGQPEPAFVSHRMQADIQNRYVFCLGKPANRRYLNVTSLAFSASRGFSLLQFLGGSTVILGPTIFAPGELVDMVRELEIDAVFLVPTIIRWLLDLPRPSGGVLFPNVDMMIMAASTMAGEEKRLAAERITSNIVELYGTSAIGTISALYGNEIHTKGESVGRPPMGIDVQVVDEAGLTLPPGEIGKIRCSAPTDLFAGNSEGRVTMDRNGDPDAPFWYYPGDVGYFDDEGYLFLKGRVSEVIIRGGVNVYPAEIEEVLMGHPAVVTAAVIGKPDNGLGEVVAAFVTGDEPMDPAILQQYCRKNLMSHKVPVEIIQVDEMPQTSVGKVRKNELAKRWEK